MTNFTEALQEKIDELEEEKERIDDKIDLLQELMDGEGGKQTKRVGKALAAKSRKAGRPKGSKNKKKGESVHAPKDEIYEEAMKQLAKSEEGGTSKELQEKLTKRFNPMARPERSLGAGITAGTKKEVLEGQGKRKTNATVSVDESDLEDD